MDNPPLPSPNSNFWQFEEASKGLLQSLAPVEDRPQTWSSYPNKCEICRIQCKTVLQLKEHYKSFHGKFCGFKCVDCNLLIPFFHAFIIHVRQHRPELEAYCPICDIYCMDIPNHTNYLSETCFGQSSFILPFLEGYVCNRCGDSFSLRSELVAHNVDKHRMLTFICRLCKQSFKNLKERDDHLEVHDNPYKCDICGRRFRLYFHLQRHLTTHSEMTSHTCGKCGLKYRYKAALTRHKSTCTPVATTAYSDRCDYNTPINIEEEEPASAMIEEATRPMIEEATRPMIEEATRPMIEEATRPMIEEATRPMIEEATRQPRDTSGDQILREYADIFLANSHRLN